MKYSKASLNTLSLSYCTSVTHLKPLLHHKCRNVTILNLSFTRIKDHLLIEYIETLGKSLIELRLCGTRVQNPVIRKTLDHCRKLKVLDLTECVLVTAEAFTICDKFRAASLTLSLETLILNHTELGDDILMKILPVTPLLTTISLVKCIKITNASLYLLGMFNRLLKSVSFEGTSLSADHFDFTFSNFLSKCTQLTQLEFPGMSFINDSTLEQIANQCHCIELLNLRMCANITNQGLGYFHSLKNLNVSYCYRLTDSSICPLIRGLETLDISFIPNLTNSVLECIQKNGESLKILKMSGNNVITSLQVGQLKDKIGCDFEELELNGCQNLSREAFERIKKRFPKCRTSFIFR